MWKETNNPAGCPLTSVPFMAYAYLFINTQIHTYIEVDTYNPPFKKKKEKEKEETAKQP